MDILEKMMIGSAGKRQTIMDLLFYSNLGPNPTNINISASKAKLFYSKFFLQYSISTPTTPTYLGN
jgi:hypothetical protein